jgi:hypothetical protein
VELNQAFAQVLYYATGENVLVETFAGVDDGQKSGFFSKLFKGKKS